jgi:hypothetical protein
MKHKLTLVLFSLSLLLHSCFSSTPECDDISSNDVKGALYVHIIDHFDRTKLKLQDSLKIYFREAVLEPYYEELIQSKEFDWRESMKRHIEKNGEITDSNRLKLNIETWKNNAEFRVQDSLDVLRSELDAVHTVRPRNSSHRIVDSLKEEYKKLYYASLKRLDSIVSLRSDSVNLIIDNKLNITSEPEMIWEDSEDGLTTFICGCETQYELDGEKGEINYSVTRRDWDTKRYREVYSSTFSFEFMNEELWEYVISGSDQNE